MSLLRFSNKGGFPCIESTGNNLTSTSSTYIFNAHQFVNNNFYGGLFIKITDTPTAPETAVPIQFTTAGVTNSTIPVLNAQGTALTTATFPGNGIYLAFYDRDTNNLQLLNV